MRIGMATHHFSYFGVKLPNRFVGLLNLLDQELDCHGRRCEDRLVATEQLEGTYAIDDLVLPLLVPYAVLTQNAANQPPVCTTELARIGPATQDAQQQRLLP